MIVSQAIPLSLYIHIPWCIRKCPYCDFNSHELTPGESLQRDYLAALFRDIEQLLPSVWGRRVSTIFLGGGTPSLLSADVVHDLLSGIRARLPLVSQAEISMEANPGSLDAKKFKEFRDAGITRLSLGVQSFNDQFLTRLGRIHSADQVHQAIEAIRESRYESFNLDLMFGLPGQDIDDAVDDLEAALGYAPPHLSLYQLTIEPNTVFSHQRPDAIPGHDEQAEMQEVLAEQLGEAGLYRYEVSAYSIATHQCRHNRNYWEFGDYLGVGAGAHSKITGHACVERFSRPRNPVAYMNQVGTDASYIKKRRLNEDDLVLEFIINATRLRDGFSLKQFELHTGLGQERLQEGLNAAQRKGLLELDQAEVKPTEKGFRFLSEIQLLFA